MLRKESIELDVECGRNLVRIKRLTVANSSTQKVLILNWADRSLKENQGNPG